MQIQWGMYDDSPVVLGGGGCFDSDKFRKIENSFYKKRQTSKTTQNTGNYTHNAITDR